MTRHLTVVQGGAEPRLSGREVLEHIAPKIRDVLPRLDREDPWRPALERLLRATEA